MEANENKDKHYGTGDEPSADNFLVNEETENVKPTGVDDKSTGMEGDDYLGKTNTEDRDE